MQAEKGPAKVPGGNPFWIFHGVGPMILPWNSRSSGPFPGAPGEPKAEFL